MGLDMYLSARQYVSKDKWIVPEKGKFADPIPNPLYKQIVDVFEASDFVNDSDFGAGITVDLPMGYWRKANAIHAYFVNTYAQGVDECQPIYVGKADLRDLLEKCKSIQGDYEKADELLPPSVGFFFGSYTIDDWYMEKIDSTIKILERCMASPYDDFIYQASW